MKFGVGIIGATGYIGTPYREEIRKTPGEARIVALCARRRDRLEAAAAEDGAILATDQWREVVEHPEVNLVLVLTPDALHYEPAMACAELRKHLLCEKPVGTTVEQAADIWHAYRDSGLAHFVPYWTRYVPVILRAKQLVDAGRLGEIRVIIYRWHNPRPILMPFTWRDDAQLSTAGSLADVGSHAYDTLRWILGREATRVLAHTSVVSPSKPNLGPIDLGEAIAWGNVHDASENEPPPQQTQPATQQPSVPDMAQLAIEFPDQTICSIVLSHASYLRKGFSPELELHGTQASLSVNRLTGELWIAESPEPAKLLETMTSNSLDNRFANYVFPAMQNQIAGNFSFHPDLEDGWKVQRFVAAAVSSASTGGWVDVSEE